MDNKRDLHNSRDFEDKDYSRSKTGLTEKEIKIIKRYAVYPKISFAALITAMFIGAFFIVFVMIDDIALRNKGLYEIGLYAYLAVVIGYLVLFLYTFLYVKIGMRGKKWRNIVAKSSASQHSRDRSAEAAAVIGLASAGRLLKRSDNEAAQNLGTAADVAGAVAAAALVADVTGEMVRNVKAVADRLHVQLPKTKKYVLCTILLPIAFLTAIYIPEFADSAAKMKSGREAAAQTVYKLAESFEGKCERVSADDPMEDYYDRGYMVMAVLREDNYKTESYMSVRVDNGGKIREVNYSCGVEVNKEKQENLDRINADIMRLNDMLVQSGAISADSEIAKVNTLPEEFVSQFMQCSYYEEMYILQDISEKTDLYINYSTKSEDEYDEYSSSYIYMSVEDSDW